MILPQVFGCGREGGGCGGRVDVEREGRCGFYHKFLWMGGWWMWRGGGCGGRVDLEGGWMWM